ncbi:hypothetical protein L873DRAFT_263179 [Choiromyces venosus 120613-1]|uniref:Uncharacterized protein n=1 Tax=Choiromyces venosus 120613-1 TaxID=1336337 RepID=A0A3N4J125_9PEZI|nr:hypothetical protein L873DRAFT_263179 [Choiromyces venosus 120613-1]
MRRPPLRLRLYYIEIWIRLVQWCHTRGWRRGTLRQIGWASFVTLKVGQSYIYSVLYSLTIIKEDCPFNILHDRSPTMGMKDQFSSRKTLRMPPRIGRRV